MQNKTNYTVPIESVIRANMREYENTLKILKTLFSVGIAVGFILFAAGGFSMASSFGTSGMGMLPVGFIMFGACGFLAAMFTAKHSAAQSLVSLLNQVEASDSIFISNLSFGSSQNPAQTLQALKALISTGHLSGYEIVSDKVIAKKSLNLKAETLTEQGVTLIKGEDKSKCPSCGAAVKNHTNFCEYCGVKL